jgi:hypothetical protein
MKPPMEHKANCAALRTRRPWECDCTPGYDTRGPYGSTMSYESHERCIEAERLAYAEGLRDAGPVFSPVWAGIGAIIGFAAGVLTEWLL